MVSGLAGAGVSSVRNHSHASGVRGPGPSTLTTDTPSPAMDPTDVIASVVDPELPMLTLHDLGVLRGVREVDGAIVVDITPTYSGCPAVAEMRADIARLLHEAGHPRVDIRIVLSPPWSTDDITSHGRAVLAEHGIAPPGPAPRRTTPVPVRLGVRVTAPMCPRCGSADTVVTSAFGPTACTALCRCAACGEPFEHMKAI
jgi:ring-1,2-phenylacetyl-CoA epoxidase subunit PaaD